jgi:S-(hydroxymethyl)glutathione dehydrogenase/alcohol dehydrogenase
MKTRAAVLRKAGTPWEITELELDPPKANEVLIQMEAAGLCHSDEHIRSRGMARLPLVGGHEGAGVVVEAGPGVTRVKVGDRVSCSYIPVCGKCRYCSTGKQNLCDAGKWAGVGCLQDETFRFHQNGEDFGGMCVVGSFAEYSVLSEWSCVKIEDDIPFELAALVSCGVTTGFCSAIYAADVRPGETVVVFGTGGVGINAIQGARYAGGKNVIAIDPVEFKRDQATKFGATHVYESMSAAIEPIINLTHGVMAEKTIIAVGDMRGEFVEEAMTLTAKTGTCVVTGMGAMTDVDVKLNLFLFTMLQKTLKGNIFGGGSSHVETPRLVGLYKSGLLKIDEMVTSTYRLEDINEGYQDMLDGKNIRGVIRYDEADW